MKLGVFGAGMIICDFLTMYKQVEGLELAYICATPAEEEKLKKLCADYDIPKYYLDMEEALADEDYDTCYIGVPNHLHYMFVKKAFEHNKNVICEKPFTSNYKEAVELVNIAKEKGLVLTEGVTTHYFPNMHKIKELIPTLGELKLVVINYSQYSSRYAKFKNGETLPAFDPAKSGGSLMDLNIYNINFIVHLFGEPNNVEYFANINEGIDTSGVLVLDYGKFKCVSVSAKDCKAPITYSIQGDEKCILLDNPVNLMTGFKVFDTVGTGFAEVDDVVHNYNDPSKHRMYYEFVEFVRMVDEKDLEAAAQAMEYSLITMKIQTEARQKAGVVFAADKS